MDLIERVLPITAGAHPSPKLARYRLADPYLRFWYQFLVPIRAAGVGDLLTPAETWSRNVRPGLDDYMGPVFEEVCRSWMRLDGGRRLPFRPIRVGEWWTQSSDHQVVVVVLGSGGELLVGECKWGRADDSDIQLLNADDLYA